MLTDEDLTYDDIEGRNSESGEGDEDYHELFDEDLDENDLGIDFDDDSLNNCDDELEDEQIDHLDNDSNTSLLRYILTIFFRIIHQFNISNNAASTILTFISFVLGMLA